MIFCTVFPPVDSVHSFLNKNEVRRWSRFRKWNLDKKKLILSAFELMSEIDELIESIKFKIH